MHRIEVFLTNITSNDLFLSLIPGRTNIFLKSENSRVGVDTWTSFIWKVFDDEFRNKNNLRLRTDRPLQYYVLFSH